LRDSSCPLIMKYGSVEIPESTEIKRAKGESRSKSRAAPRLEQTLYATHFWAMIETKKFRLTWKEEARKNVIENVQTVTGLFSVCALLSRMPATGGMTF